MLFICTCKWDTTTDVVTRCLSAEDTFRFNIDARDDFSWDFNRSGFIISDSYGRSITQNELTSFYLRKPMFFEDIDIPAGGSLENWRREEIQELFRDFYFECEGRGLVVLVHPKSSHHGKLRQMWVAQKHFPVADWHMFHGRLPDELKSGSWIFKTLTGTQIGAGKVFFTKEVVPNQLDLSYPWFLQRKIDGEDEVTVVYVNGQMQAYSFPRKSIVDCEDVRCATLEKRAEWKPCELTESEKSAIRAFMDETGYRFGRFDFIRKDGELWFLEMNPNGQWAWLDPKDENGLISMIANAIKSEDAQHHQRY